MIIVIWRVFWSQFIKKYYLTIDILLINHWKWFQIVIFSYLVERSEPVSSSNWVRTFFADVVSRSASLRISAIFFLRSAVDKAILASCDYLFQVFQKTFLKLLCCLQVLMRLFGWARVLSEAKLSFWLSVIYLDFIK